MTIFASMYSYVSTPLSAIMVGDVRVNINNAIWSGNIIARWQPPENPKPNPGGGQGQKS